MKTSVLASSCCFFNTYEYLTITHCEVFVLQIAHFQQTQIERVTTHYRHKSMELEQRLKEVTEQAYR